MAIYIYRRNEIEGLLSGDETFCLVAECLLEQLKTLNASQKSGTTKNIFEYVSETLKDFMFLGFCYSFVIYLFIHLFFYKVMSL